MNALVSVATFTQPAQEPTLVIRRGPQTGERFLIDQDRLTIGRDPHSDIFLNDVTVSRVHTVLSVDSGVVSITDAGSMNGTYVNGVLADEHALGDGDVVQVGRFQVVYSEGPRRGEEDTGCESLAVGGGVRSSRMRLRRATHRSQAMPRRSARFR